MTFEGDIKTKRGDYHVYAEASVYWGKDFFDMGKLYLENLWWTIWHGGSKEPVHGPYGENGEVSKDLVIEIEECLSEKFYELAMEKRMHG